MKTRTLVPLILFSIAVALPGCEGGEPSSVGTFESALISFPDPCAGGDPTCVTANDFPTDTDLTADNSGNINFSVVSNSLELAPGLGILLDTDGDGVPDAGDDCAGVGWRTPCDGDASNDGYYATAVYGSGGSSPVAADIDVSAGVGDTDIYILIDGTGSMGSEKANIVKDLTTGTFTNENECPAGVGTGLVGAMKCELPQLWLGVGAFKEIPLSPHADPYAEAPYHHYADLTDNLQYIIDSIAAVVSKPNNDQPEATTQAIYSVVTGQGLGPWVPNRAGCTSSFWGYPCFRNGAIPMILIFTDGEMFNGPRAASPTYGNPPFDGTVGLGTRLPPVQMSPDVLYSNDVFSAWNLGDLSTTSMTVMGSTATFADDANTWDVGNCYNCGGSGCWGDGLDAFVKFSLAAPTNIFVSGEGTNYPETNVALVDSTLSFVGCDNGPGGGDYWGRMAYAPLAAGTWYLVSDGAVPVGATVAEKRGPYQLRIQTTADNATWQTADLPIAWADVETELLARGVKFISVVSPNDNGGLVARDDVDALGYITDSIDGSTGKPWVQGILGNGSGMGKKLVKDVREIAGDTRRDITLVAEDNLATPAIDETNFVTAIEASICQTGGNNDCRNGGAGSDTCRGCLGGAEVQFVFQIGNDFVPSAAVAQVFDFDLVAYADGTDELNRFPVRIVVPGTGTGFGAGFYENTYDSSDACVIPPDRADWGFLTWSGSTPSDSSIAFDFYFADSLAELDTEIPTTIEIPTDTTDSVIDVSAALEAAGEQNFKVYLRIVARLLASSDNLVTPTLDGWSMQFNCVPYD